MRIGLWGWCTLSALLGACGGGSDATDVAPSGLQIGFFQEAASDPDPMPASFYVHLPAGDGSHTGAVSAQYVDCQSANVLSVTGTRTAGALSGNWSGPVDGTTLAGTLAGSFDRSNQRYTGTYTKTGAAVTIGRCDSVSYTFAASGTWELVAVGAKTPTNFDITVAGGQMQWTDVPGVTRWLARVYDESLAQSGDSGVAQQRVQAAAGGTATDQALSLPALTSGRDYVLAVTAFNALHQRVAYTSLRYRAP